MYIIIMKCVNLKEKLLKSKISIGIALKDRQRISAPHYKLVEELMNIKQKSSSRS